MAPDDEDVDALIARCLIHDCILDVVFDLIRSIKSSDAPIHELCAPPRRQPDIETRNGHPPTSKETPKEGGALFESLAPFREPKGEFRCAHCGQKVSALRYAPHLDKCMGKGCVLFLNPTHAYAAGAVADSPRRRASLKPLHTPMLLAILLGSLAPLSRVIGSR